LDGVPLRLSIRNVSAGFRAKIRRLQTADELPTSSIDMASGRAIPQNLLAIKYGGDTLADPFGYPMRLARQVKLGIQEPRNGHEPSNYVTNKDTREEE